MGSIDILKRKLQTAAVFTMINTALLFFASTMVLEAQEAEIEPVSISVVVANPSKEKIQTIPVKIDLPQEITPADILEKGDMEVKYDDQRSIYFLYNEAVELKPKETRIFNVQVKNVWIIPEEKLSELKFYGDLLLKKLERSEYYDSGKRLYDSVVQKLDEIRMKQNDETLGQKQRIGAYRFNLLAIEEIKEYLAKMEKILSFQGGPPVPYLLEESELKSDAPSTKTTWLIILSILVFLGLLGAQFFYTWHKRAVSEKSFMESQKNKLPGGTHTPGDTKQAKIA